MKNSQLRRHLIVLIDYFSKWSGAKQTKSALAIAQFLYEVMCQHGCFEIQINAQSQEFVNEVSKQLQELTGVKQRAMPAYHLQTKGLEERQN